MGANAIETPYRYDGAAEGDPVVLVPGRNAATPMCAEGNAQTVPALAPKQLTDDQLRAIDIPVLAYWRAKV